MATNNPLVNTLPQYTEEKAIELVAKSVLGGKSASMFNLQTGIKGATAINELETDVQIQDGSDCGWNEAGDTKLSQRVINAKPLKVNMAFCDKKLYKTYANYLVKTAAGQKTLPFEEEWTNQIVEGVNAGIEHLIYNGDGGNPNEFDGLLTIIVKDSIPVDAKPQGYSVYSAIKDAYMALPEVALKNDTVILVSAGLFRAFIQELVSANLYHFKPTDNEGEYMLPGTNVKVVAVNGLNGGRANEDYIIAGRLSNLFYGTDLESDSANFDLWYDKSEREFRLAIEFVGGTQIAFPDEISVVKIARQ